MKTMRKFNVLVLLILFISVTVSAQVRDLQNWRPNDKRGLNVFEDPIADTVEYQEFLVRVGGDFTMQFQGLNQSNNANTLRELGTDFNLPSANLNLDVQLAEGMRMHLRTYLSARHHAEAWIKGGHMQITNLNFIQPGFLENVMQYTTIRIGLDEFNYGDAHFRRSDNARTIFNPFVGNYIMDAFSTEAFGEITVQTENGLLAVLGLTNGKLNQNVTKTAASDNKPSFYGKLGFDRQLNDDLRVRLTGSVYTNQGTTTGTWLYGGDRAGSRYYYVLHAPEVRNAEGEITTPAQGTNFDGRYNARFTQLTAFQVNPFIKYGGLEFFGVYEVAGGSAEIQGDTEDSFTQVAGELLYRFGGNENFYVGGRYNTISGKMRESHAENLQISRFNIGGGWFMTRNVLTKIEYVSQKYEGDAWTGRFAGAEFSGIVIEAAISF
jgi:hypothetical protein